MSLINIGLIRFKVRFCYIRCYIKKRAMTFLTVFKMNGLDGLERQRRSVLLLA